MIPVASLNTAKYGVKIQIAWIDKLDRKVIAWLKLVCYLNMDAMHSEFSLCWISNFKEVILHTGFGGRFVHYVQMLCFSPSKLQSLPSNIVQAEIKWFILVYKSKITIFW